MLAKAEVRNSGRGLHVILRLGEPYQLDSDAARERIVAVNDVVTRILPRDPMQPGITAVTRAINSVNGKNGKPVRLLAPGEPIPFAEVMQFGKEITAAPMLTIGRVLFDGGPVRPCPLCRADESSLMMLKHVVRCYACGQHTIDDLLRRIYRSSGTDRMEARNVC